MHARASDRRDRVQLHERTARRRWQFNLDYYPRDSFFFFSRRAPRFAESDEKSDREARSLELSLIYNGPPVRSYAARGRGRHGYDNQPSKSAEIRLFRAGARTRTHNFSRNQRVLKIAYVRRRYVRLLDPVSRWIRAATIVRASCARVAIRGKKKKQRKNFWRSRSSRDTRRPPRFDANGDPVYTVEKLRTLAVSSS